MKLAVLGAGGNVGRRVVSEALSRGHRVTAVVRSAWRRDDLPSEVRFHVADVVNAEEVAAACAGHDVIVSATRPPLGQEVLVEPMTRGLLRGVADSGARLIVVGGAATLRVPGSAGRTVLKDVRYLPASARPAAAASARQYEICLADTCVDWVYLSPPAQLDPGQRTGRYRLGADELVVDRAGNSRISMEDLAAAILDEAERPRHHRKRFTVAW